MFRVNRMLLAGLVATALASGIGVKADTLT